MVSNYAWPLWETGINKQTVENGENDDTKKNSYVFEFDVAAITVAQQTHVGAVAEGRGAGRKN